MRSWLRLESHWNQCSSPSAHSPTTIRSLTQGFQPLHQTTPNRLRRVPWKSVAEGAHEVSLELDERLRFETLIADLSLRFVSVAADRVDREIKDAQRAICECLGLEHSSLWQASIHNPDELVLTHLYRDPELPKPPERMRATEFFPWTQAKLMAGEIVSVPNTAEAPPEASTETGKHGSALA